MSLCGICRGSSEDNTADSELIGLAGFNNTTRPWPRAMVVVSFMIETRELVVFGEGDIRHYFDNHGRCGLAISEVIADAVTCITSKMAQVCHITRCVRFWR